MWLYKLSKLISNFIKRSNVWKSIGIVYDHVQAK